MRSYLDQLQMLINIKQHHIDQISRRITLSSMYMITIDLDEIDELMAEQARCYHLQ